MDSAARHLQCEICSQLKEVDSAFRKAGEEEDDTWLPSASDRLELVREIDGSHQLKRCPLCGTYYLYEWYYEYFVYGSEDSESLRRINDEGATKYLV